MGEQTRRRRIAKSIVPLSHSLISTLPCRAAQVRQPLQEIRWGENYSSMERKLLFSITLQPLPPAVLQPASTATVEDYQTRPPSINADPLHSDRGSTQRGEALPCPTLPMLASRAAGASAAGAPRRTPMSPARPEYVERGGRPAPVFLSLCAACRPLPMRCPVAHPSPPAS